MLRKENVAVAINGSIGNKTQSLSVWEDGIMNNIWLVKFSKGTKVEVISTGRANMDWAVGKVGEVTGFDPVVEMYGVHFGPAPKWTSGKSWTEFFDFQLKAI